MSIEATRFGACAACLGVCRWVECPVGGWWSHQDHPADDHDAVVLNTYVDTGPVADDGEVRCRTCRALVGHLHEKDCPNRMGGGAAEPIWMPRETVVDEEEWDWAVSDEESCQWCHNGWVPDRMGLGFDRLCEDCGGRG